MSEFETYSSTSAKVFSVDQEHRVIRGLVVPFNEVGDNGRGKFVFTDASELTPPGDLSRLKLTYPGHNEDSPVGYATEFEKHPEGIVAAFKIGRGAKGDEALQAAEDHLYDGLSMGLGKPASFAMKDGVQYGVKAPVRHVALTPAPAFSGARVTSVAASAVTDRKEPDMGEQITEVEAPGALDFTPVFDKIDGLAAKFEGLNLSKPEVVPAGHPTAEVTEPLPYRFDGEKGEYDFSGDLIAGMFHGDGIARQRLSEFLGEVNFAAVASTDVAALNPSRYRPDLYVDQIQPSTPVLDAITVGSVTDSTPFIVPKFASATNYVAAHTQGTEPTNTATFTATSQTVTPTAVSGYGEITREVIDAGGNPKVSALLWTQFQREYRKALETYAATFINGLTLTELATVLDASDEATTPGTIAKIFEADLGALLWIDGGENFTGVLVPQDIWAPIAATKDKDDRPMYPIKNPSNANGSVGNRYRSMEIGGFTLTPAKSLGTTADKAYVFDPAFGGVWHSGATQIALPETVANGYRVGIFGYTASALLDTNKIRKVTLQA